VRVGPSVTHVGPPPRSPGFPADRGCRTATRATATTPSSEQSVLVLGLGPRTSLIETSLCASPAAPRSPRS
jgi:hypothetical protein